MASMSTPSSAAAKVFSIVELTEDILASGVNMIELFKLKRVNHHFYDTITSSSALQQAMFLAYKPSKSTRMQSIPIIEPVLEFNPKLVAALSACGHCDYKAGFTCGIDIEQTYDDFPKLISAIDQCLQADEPWLETLISSVETDVFVKLERGKEPDKVLDPRWPASARRDFVIYSGEKAGDMLRELRAHAAYIQRIPHNVFVDNCTRFTSNNYWRCLVHDYERRRVKTDVVRHLISIWDENSIASLLADEAGTDGGPAGRRCCSPAGYGRSFCGYG